MIPLLAASLMLRAQAGAAILPQRIATALPAEVLDWPGFRFLPAGPRSAPDLVPVPADWSRVKGSVAADAVVWRVKVVLLERTDRAHERGPGFVWPGHYGMLPPVVERVRRALPQLRALVAEATRGAVDLRFDVTEETEAISIDGGDLPAVVKGYLEPRINGGRYEAEDGQFRGPYTSALVIHPMGGEPPVLFDVQDTPVALVGLPDVDRPEVDGGLAHALWERWRLLADRRATQAGLPFPLKEAGLSPDWRAILAGADNPTDARLRLRAAARGPSALEPTTAPVAEGPLGPDTTVRIVKDPTRGSVLLVQEGGPLRGGGVALPKVQGIVIDVAKTPTFAFWMRSEARDPVVVGFRGKASFTAGLGRDVPFAYDGQWHRVKIDLRSVGPVVEDIVIGPDRPARAAMRDTIGPIVAWFSDMVATDEAPDAKPVPEPPSPTSTEVESRARWAALSGPGEERRALLKDSSEAVKANAASAALARPDPGDEAALIDDALYTFEPTVFTPALRALGNLKTPTAREALRRAVRIAAADRARGLAAEILAEGGDPRLVAEFVGLNQARSSAARRSAVRALGRIKGGEATLMRMAYLPQADPSIKLEATLTADPDDDYQGRKLLWSAVNETSDAVRLESLRRLSRSRVPEFRAEGLKGIHDDSVGVRVGLLQAWAAARDPAALPAIREALADRAPRVRATALAALAPFGESVEPKALPLDDPDPRVQIALVRLLSAKGVPLPKELRDRLRLSPDPEVRASIGPL